MIHYLKGNVIQRQAKSLVLDVQGVGYGLHVSERMEAEEGEKGVELHVYTSVRENALELFGFLTIQEREVFLLLQKVDRIGPKLSMGILSAVDPSDLAHLIREKDIVGLTKIPGVGKSTAESIALKLSELMIPYAGERPSRKGGLSLENEAPRQALEALIALGYSERMAREGILKASEALKKWPDVGEITRLALREI